MKNGLLREALGNGDDETEQDDFGAASRCVFPRNPRGA